MQLEFGADGCCITFVKAVLGELLLFQEPNIAIRFVPRPAQGIHALHVLQERADALEAVSELHRNRIEVHPSTLLKVSELRDFQTVEEHLPANAPRAERGRFPIVFLEADVVFLERDAQGREAL